jgi:hypothetical protein
MGTPRYPKDMATEWQALKRKVSNTFTSANSRLGTESIGAKIVNIFSGLVVNAGAFFRSMYSNGNEAVYIGSFVFEGDPDELINEGIYIKRPNGSIAFFAYGDVDLADFSWSMFDLAGNSVVGDDLAGGGVGLSDPEIPYTPVRTALLTTPATTNTTTTYAPHHTVQGWQQHPTFVLTVYVQNTGTAKAKIRCRDTLDSSIVWESAELDTGWHTWFIGHSVNVWKAYFTYDFEIKVSSGTGSVGFTITNMQGCGGVGE